MKLFEFKAELITRWYEIAPFSEMSIREDDHYGGSLKVHIEWFCRGTVRCYDTLLSYSELSDAKYNVMDTILNKLTGAYYSTLLLKNKEKKDSREGCEQGLCWKTCKFSPHWCGSTPRYIVGENDHSLMQRLASAGTDHRKFMRMMPVYVRITAPLYWWKEFDTYKVGTVANSCSTMHKIQEKEFTLEDFSCEHLISDWIGDNNDAIWYKDPPKNGSIECPIIFSPLDALRTTIGVLNTNREAYLKTKDKKFWWQMIQLLPSSYNQTRNVMMNYEVLANIYKSRKDHKLDEWRNFCEWIEELPYSELITGGVE